MHNQDPFLNGHSKNSYTTLQDNVQAVKEVVSVVEPTLGPKGLDVMLVDQDGNLIVTNDGSTILSMMKIDHPVSRMLIKVADAQQKRIGDGSTTATLLAASLVEEGAHQVMKGIPIIKVINGIQKGVTLAINKLKEHAYAIQGLGDEWLHRIAFTASRGYEDIALSVMDAIQLIGEEQLKKREIRLSDAIVTHPNAEGIVFAGVVIKQSRTHANMPSVKERCKILVLTDDLMPPEQQSEDEWHETLQQQLQKISQHSVGVILTSGRIHPLAIEMLIELGIMTLVDVQEDELLRVAEHTGTQPIRSTALQDMEKDLSEILGYAEEAEDDQLLNWVRISGGGGKREATILLGGSTDEVIQERERICKDVSSAVQAAVRGGFVPGGGAIELAIARELEQYIDKIPGLERYGISVVAESLHRPIAQVVTNAGYNSLEKLELVKRAQQSKKISSLGFDCDRGHVVDMLEVGVVDPLLIKLNALATAAEVSTAILRIHTIIPTKK